MNKQMLIREHTEKLLQGNYLKGFYFAHFSQYSELSSIEVEAELNKMTEQGIIGKEYEAICPKCQKILERKEQSEDFQSHYACNACSTTSGSEQVTILTRYTKIN